MTPGQRAKLAIAAVSACVAYGATQGFAATLGTAGGGLGATSRIVESCGSGLTVGYGATFEAGILGYAIDRIELSNIPAGCLGRSFSATFYRSGGGVAGAAVSATLPAAGTTQTIAVDPVANAVDASQVDGVSVVVS